ncbi:MAG: DUF4231 domain-containing protein [Myxococcales bacterium]|nr:DUF4231 domain-containing protein [Myxococcales bacterium]
MAERTHQSTEIDADYVLRQYKDKIDYYWGASRHNKKAYKSVRTLSIILGSAVTLVSSISAASFVQDINELRVFFAVLTPIIAATLTVISGLGQNFHWGATWRDMVINAIRLEKERDRFLATEPSKRNLEAELEILNGIVLEETKTFFRRVLDSEVRPTDKNQPETEGKP